MRRHGKLYPQICAWDNIVAAFYLARRNKRRMPAVLNFERDLENNMRVIQASLIDKTFHTAKYLTRTVHEPKRRTIYILPFYPDRISSNAFFMFQKPAKNCHCAGRDGFVFFPCGLVLTSFCDEGAPGRTCVQATCNFRRKNTMPYENTKKFPLGKAFRLSCYPAQERRDHFWGGRAECCPGSNGAYAILWPQGLSRSTPLRGVP